MKINYDRKAEDYTYKGRDANAPKNIYDLAHHLSDATNGGYLKATSAFGNGVVMGMYLRQEHQTLQGCIINFLLGVLCGLANQKYTDPRNETGVETCGKIRDLLESEEIYLQPFI